MSYARFGSDSDVYVYMDTRDVLVCCGCCLQDREWVDEPGSFLGGYLKEIGEIIATEFDSTQGMVDHLQRHITEGHAVPDDVIPALRADDAENFPVHPATSEGTEADRG